MSAWWMWRRGNGGGSVLRPLTLPPGWLLCCRGPWPGSDQERMATLTLPPGAQTLGKPLGDLALHAMGVSVVNLRHSNGRMSIVRDATVLAEGDTLVLSGHPAALALAEDRLLRG